jgi:hypothetical protein
LHPRPRRGYNRGCSTRWLPEGRPITIPLSGAGGLFTRLGHEFAGIQDVQASRGGPPSTRTLAGANMATRVLGTVIPDYAAGTPLAQVVDGSPAALSAYQQALVGFLNYFQTTARNTLLAMYAVDQQAVSPNAPLSQLTAGFTLAQALQTLVAQMKTAAATVQAATVTAGALTAVGAPVGNPTAVVSLKNGQGAALQLCFPETLTLRITGDSQSGGATLGNEPYAVTGQAAVADALSHLWPGGSGVSATGNLVDGSKDNSAGNMLQNSNFLAFTTANYPDNWLVGSGSAGTQILNGSGTTYLPGGGSVQFVGHATAAGIAQAFGTTPSTAAGVGGTSAVLKPDTVYHYSIPYKLSLASPAAGVLEAALTDGSAWPGAVLADDAAANNTANVALTGVADANWHVLSGSFRTPAVLPTTAPVARLRVQLSTALSVGTSVYVGQPSFSAPAGPSDGALYAGGPFLTLHRGPNRVIAGLTPDSWTLAVGNSYSTSGGGLLQQYFERIFGLRNLKLQLGASGSPTLSDALIS